MLFQHAAQARIRTIKRIGKNKTAGYARIQRRADHLAGNHELAGEGKIRGDGCLGPALLILRPDLRQIKPPVNQGRAVTAGIAQENTHLRILDPARRA